MDLRSYLDQQGETQESFSERSGVPQTTLSGIIQGRGCHARTAQRVIRATGGLVSLEDLTGDEQPAQAAS